jgi:hypothetical protein
VPIKKIKHGYPVNTENFRYFVLLIPEKVGQLKERAAAVPGVRTQVQLGQLGGAVVLAGETGQEGQR